MIKFIDVAHHYLGCKMINLNVKKVVEDSGKIYTPTTLKMVSFSKTFWVGKEPESRHLAETVFKPCLRRLSSATHIEKETMAEYANIYDGTNLVEALMNKTKYLVKVTDSFELAIYLCKQGFDIFGLIDSGEAYEAQ